MFFRWPCILGFLLTLLSSVARVRGFTFQNTEPTECGTFTVTWTGGTAPYRLIIIPPAGTLRNISIPASGYGTSGSFSTQLLFAQNQRIMFSMSDATGVTAGGITDLLTVGAPTGGASCNTTDPGVDFFFSLDSDLQQCKNYPFTNFGGAIQPVTAFGFIPEGPSFVVNPPLGDSFSWPARFPAGTEISFFMTDAQNRNGGTSSIKVVASSNDASCLQAASTSSSRSSSGTASPTETGKTDNQNGGGKSSGRNSNLGIIIGSAAGGFVVLCLLAFAFVFCVRRKKGQNGAVQEPKLDLTYDPKAGTSAPPPTSYLLPSAYSLSNTNVTSLQAPTPYPPTTSYAPSVSSVQLASTSNPMSSQQSEFNPYSSQASSSAAALGQPYGQQQQRSIYSQPSVAPTHHGTLYAINSDMPTDQYAHQQPYPVGSTSGKYSKPSPQPQPVVMHKDIEESMELPEELPPQYSESRAPIPGFPNSYNPNNSSASSTVNSRTPLRKS